MNMPNRQGNRGIISTGSGQVNVSNTSFGDHSPVTAPPVKSPERTSPEDAFARADIGVVTVLSEETNAVVGALSAVGNCQKRTHGDGLRFYDAVVDPAGSPVRVAVTQALSVGPMPTVIAVENLRRHYGPAVVVLVGIAGGIHPSVSLGDVVVVQEVIYYDLRKETQAGVVRRGQTRPVPAVIRRAVNDFFSTHGEPYLVHSTDPDGAFRDYKALPGPIGSGEAVIAYKGSDIRRYLTAFNDKTLAVETEAGGIAEAFYETADEPGTGWLAIRGISDHADADKDDAFHQMASWHAAATLVGLLPYLKHR
jgi:adenosylhomocysteine nucleosidase